MASVMNGTLDVTRTGDHFADEYGDRWFIVADDARGCYAVDREDGGAAGIIRDGLLYDAKDGRTFDVNTPDEFIVVNDEWQRNVAK